MRNPRKVCPVEGACAKSHLIQRILYLLSYVNTCINVYETRYSTVTKLYNIPASIQYMYLETLNSFVFQNTYIISCQLLECKKLVLTIATVCVSPEFTDDLVDF